VVAQGGDRRVGAPRAAAVPVHGTRTYRPRVDEGWTLDPKNGGPECLTRVSEP
jgi:hypothetical protein